MQYIIESGNGYLMGFIGENDDTTEMTSDPMEATWFTTEQDASEMKAKMEASGLSAEVVELHFEGESSEQSHELDPEKAGENFGGERHA